MRLCDVSAFEPYLGGLTRLVTLEKRRGLGDVVADNANGNSKGTKRGMETRICMNTLEDGKYYLSDSEICDADHFRDGNA